MKMTLKEGRKWWEMRIKYPFVGDMQKELDSFQERLIAAGEEPIYISPNEPRSACKAIFGLDL